MSRFVGDARDLTVLNPDGTVKYAARPRHITEAEREYSRKAFAEARERGRRKARSKPSA